MEEDGILLLLVWLHAPPILVTFDTEMNVKYFKRNIQENKKYKKSRGPPSWSRGGRCFRTPFRAMTVVTQIAKTSQELRMLSSVTLNS